MTVELSQTLVEEYVQRLRDAAQAPPGVLGMLARKLVRRQAQPPVPIAWVARSSQMRVSERLAA